jgi:hypothetical protein
MVKGQIWSMDLIFAIVIFSFTITTIGVAWLHISNGISTSYSSGQGLMYIQSSAMVDTLLSQGFPVDWSSTINSTMASSWKGVVPGIENAAGQPQISGPKLYAFMSMASSNYTATKALFGIGSDYYIVISSPGGGIGNITIGHNPLLFNASTILVSRRSAVLAGSPIWVNVEVWTNSSAGAG